MTSTNPSLSPEGEFKASRSFHRTTCVLAGGLAAVGGVLALIVHPWFAALAAVGGLWLIFAKRDCE